MNHSSKPPVDEDDPASPAVEVTPEKIDLQEKTPNDRPPKPASDRPPGADRKPASVTK